ncbi:mating-type protein MAT alpha 1-domain-containing protein [Aspergillus crustosus]
MENALSPLQRAFNAFLLTMPPQQLEDLVKYLRDVKAQEQGQQVQRTEVPAARANTVPDTNRGSPVLLGPNPRPAAARGRRAQDGKRRPLNSFIAFRSFYSAMFPDLTQKAKSGILRYLWQNDPFKAKWTILAKAYSIIRDEHDAEVSFDSFLTLNSKLIGIIEPGRYLDAMGWELAENGQQQYTMARVKTAVATEAQLTTNCSVEDLIKHCYETGYVTEDQRKKETQGRNAPVMSFATQPTLIINQNDPLEIAGNHTIVSTESHGNIRMAPPSPEPTEATGSPYQNGIANPMLEDTAFEVADAHSVYHDQQTQNPPADNYLELANLQLVNWDDPGALLPYNTAPLMQDQFDAFDFNPYLNI